MEFRIFLFTLSYFSLSKKTPGYVADLGKMLEFACLALSLKMILVIKVYNFSPLFGLVFDTYSMTGFMTFHNMDVQKL